VPEIVFDSIKLFPAVQKVTVKGPRLVEGSVLKASWQRNCDKLCPHGGMPNLGKRTREEEGVAETGRAMKNAKPSGLKIKDDIMHGEEVVHDLRDRLVWGSDSDIAHHEVPPKPGRAAAAAERLVGTRLFPTPSNPDKRQSSKRGSREQSCRREESMPQNGGSSMWEESLATELAQERKENAARARDERFWSVAFVTLLPMLVLWMLWLHQLPASGTRVHSHVGAGANRLASGRAPRARSNYKPFSPFASTGATQAGSADAPAYGLLSACRILWSSSETLWADAQSSATLFAEQHLDPLFVAEFKSKYPGLKAAVWKIMAWIASGLPPLLLVNIVIRRTPVILS